MNTTTLKKNSAGKEAETAKGPAEKTKTVIFWEKNPKGVINVLDRRAVNK